MKNKMEKKIIFNFYKELEANFQQTKIGKIPKDWEIRKLSDIVNKIKGKNPKELCNNADEECLPYLEAQVLRGNKEPEHYKVSKDLIIANPGDIVIIWDGSYAGEVFLIKEQGILSSTMVKLILKTSDVNSVYLYYYLLSRKKVLMTKREGIGTPHVISEVFENLPVIFPKDLEEQKAIAEVLSIFDKRKELLQKKKEIMERIKKVLMNLLLTGKIRIKIS